ncbi:hypothetical protein EDB84DRAFT_1279306 [Lactarius hengduanensis]|nr:hypothetical protein EDB84DRAFT_1279306 [Lactarius hengduanensis]
MDLPMQRWGKCNIPGGVTLRSRVSEEGGQASRSSRYFEAQGEEGPIFGEALAFYSLPDHDCSLVVCHWLVEIVDVLGRWSGEWSSDCMVLETSSLTNLVGVWAWGANIHILRKHPGLDMLSSEEHNIGEQEEE